MAVFSMLKGLKAIEGPLAQEEAERTFEERRGGGGSPGQLSPNGFP